MNDSALVAGVRAAEPYAVSALYDAYADQLFAYCVSSLRHHDDAADATQDTFVKAIEHIDQLRDPAKLRPWLFTIARHEVANQGRRRARLRLVDDEPDSPAEVPEPTKELSQEELSDLLWSAASGLQSRDREVMALHLRSGMDAPEIAAVLGISVEHARVLMARMRDRLERSIGCLLLARHGGDDCDGLARTLRGWDGQFSVRVRDRVNRHASACAGCSARRAALLTPARLLPAGVGVAAAALIRKQTVEAMLRAAAAHRRPRLAVLARLPPGAAVGVAAVAAVAFSALAAAALTGTDDTAASVPTSAGPSVPAVHAVDDHGPASVATDPEPPSPPGPAGPADVSPRSIRSAADLPAPAVHRVDSPAAPAGTDPAPTTPSCGALDLNRVSVRDLTATVPLTSAVVTRLLTSRPIGSLTELATIVPLDDLIGLLEAGVCVVSQLPEGTSAGSGTCGGTVDLNSADRGALSSLRSLGDVQGAVDQLLSARPVKTVGEAIAVTGIDPSLVARDVIAGRVCIGPVPDISGLVGETLPPSDGSVPVPDLDAVTDVVDDVVANVEELVDDLVPARPRTTVSSAPGASSPVVTVPPVLPSLTVPPVLPPVTVPSTLLPSVTVPSTLSPPVTVPSTLVPSTLLPRLGS